MERIPSGSAPTYQPEGVSGPENVQYRNQLQINLAKLAFPDAAKPMNAWMEGGDDSLAAKFGTWFETPGRPHVHLDEVDSLTQLLNNLRNRTIH